MTYLELCHFLNSIMASFFVFGILYFVACVVLYNACCNVLPSESKAKRKSNESDYCFCLSLFCSDGIYWLISLVTFNIIKALHQQDLVLFIFVVVLVLAAVGVECLSHYYKGHNIDYDNKCRHMLSCHEKSSFIMSGFACSTDFDIIVMLMMLLPVI